MLDEKPEPGPSRLQWEYRTANAQLEVRECKADEAMNEVAERES